MCEISTVYWTMRLELGLQNSKKRLLLEKNRRLITMGDYVKKKKDMNFRSLDSLNPIVNVV